RGALGKSIVRDDRLTGRLHRGDAGTIDSPSISRNTERVSRLVLRATIDVRVGTIDLPGASRSSESASRDTERRCRCSEPGTIDFPSGTIDLPRGTIDLLTACARFERLPTSRVRYRLRHYGYAVPPLKS